MKRNGDVMQERSPRKWTDAEVRAFLEAEHPLERWRVGRGLYGNVTASGEECVCMDDDDERAARIIQYLIKTRAPNFRILDPEDPSTPDS